MDPQLFLEKTFSTKSDVYSFGIVMWELVMYCMAKRYERPFAGAWRVVRRGAARVDTCVRHAEFKNITLDFQIIYQTAKKGLRPTIPENAPPLLANLMQRCWALDPADRPDMDHCVVLLRRALADLVCVCVVPPPPSLSASSRWIRWMHAGGPSG